MQHKVLIVDDDPTIRDLLKDVLSLEPYAILSAGSAEEALAMLAQESVDVVISDEKMPGMSGSEFLSVVRQDYPDTIRMILTGHASLETAIRAINEGEIYRFFTKPCNVFDLAMTTRQALHQKDLQRESQRLLKMAKRQLAFIKSLEKEYPGITRVKKDAKGEIVLDKPFDEAGSKTLVEQIASTIKKCEALFQEKP